MLKQIDNRREVMSLEIEFYFFVFNLLKLFIVCILKKLIFVVTLQNAHTLINNLLSQFTITFLLAGI